MNPKKTLALIALLLIVAMFNAPHSASADMPGHLRIVSLEAFKYQGSQPLDVSVQVTNDFGIPVSDADVIVATNNDDSKPIHLTSLGKGTYTGCDIAYLDGLSVGVAVEASRAGMTGASASTTSKQGNLCGDGMPQMIVAQIAAAKPDGKSQPLDIAINLRDELGRPVVGANVVAQITDNSGTGRSVDVFLTDRGNGLYSLCAAGLFDTSGAGAINIHVRAYGAGFRGAEANGQNSVGTICSTSAVPPPAATLSDSAALHAR